MGRGSWLVVALTASMAGVAFGQQPPPPVFTAGADLVEVDVVVQDRDGKFVTDLSLDDFDVQDEGHPQHLEQFYLRLGDDLRKTQSGASSASTAAADAAGPPAGPHFFVVVFDDAHLTPSGFKRVQAAAQSLLKSISLTEMSAGSSPTASSRTTA